MRLIAPIDKLTFVFMWRETIEPRFLGYSSVVCDGCGATIPISRDRIRCIECKKDFCLHCEACPAHATARYAGFPLLQERAVVLAKAQQYLGESCGPTFGSSAIYISILSDIAAYVQAKSAPESSAPVLQLATQLPADYLRALDTHGERFLCEWVSLRDMGRFVEYTRRRSVAGRLPGHVTWWHSQGSHGPLSWRGIPMMRTVWDFALLPIMTQEIRPATIVELGTASGAAALWYADLQRMNGLAPRVITLDMAPPTLAAAGVTFLQADIHQIADHLPASFMREQPHPWLIIDDAHVNTEGVLRHFDSLFSAGDYLAIEDLDAERALVPFLSSRPGAYLVDARYTDYFGHNATSCADQIFRRMN